MCAHIHTKYNTHVLSNVCLIYLLYVLYTQIVKPVEKFLKCLHTHAMSAEWKQNLYRTRIYRT